MKRKVKSYDKLGKPVIKEINYIPIRYIIAVLLTIIETLLIIAIVIFLCIYIPYFWVLSVLTQVGVLSAIVCSNDNPDYKVPWIVIVILLPIIGYILYFLFYYRKLSKKYIKRLNKIKSSFKVDDSNSFSEIDDKLIKSQFYHLQQISDTHLYSDSKIKYYSCGEDYFADLLNDLKNANEYILLEYFIVENGVFWDSILEVLKEKAKSIMVKVIWDDIGCMSTLPGDYFKSLRKMGIDATTFSRLKGNANSEFNNRNHRKILVIDGMISYTGGINIADEYINRKKRFGYWKDTGIRIEGNATNELTRLFLIDFYLNKKKIDIEISKIYKKNETVSDGFIMPFGDGPRPIYNENVSKIVIMNMLNQAKDYVYITTPYLIVDSEMQNAIANACKRGIDIRIIVPHIPDKKIVFEITKSNYQELIKKGVKIYEYEPGFIHSKLFICDDELAMIGTINLDYRSLVHHFENGVLIYKSTEIRAMKKDFIDTYSNSIYMNDIKVKNGVFMRLFKIFVRIFIPML